MTTYNLTVPNKNGSYDGDYVIKHYTTLTVSSGNTLTTDQPCKGMFIYVQGDCTINGTISMRGRGAAANPDSYLNSAGIKYPVLHASTTATLSAADFTGCGTAITTAVANQPGPSGNGKIINIPKRGNSGGAAISAGISSQNSGNTGSAASVSDGSTVTVYLAGGGSGGEYSDNNSCNGNTTVVTGRGGNATAFSGGCGGGGKMSGVGVSNANATDGSDNGGEGGHGGNGHCGGPHLTAGGVGNPGGYTQYQSQSQGGFTRDYQRVDTGTGGVVWLVVGGNLTIGSSGAIDVRGTDNTYQSSNVYGAGAGSGGGAAILLYRGSYTNSGSIQTTGGGGSSGQGNGGAGGAGTYYTNQIK